MTNPAPPPGPAPGTAQDRTDLRDRIASSLSNLFVKGHIIDGDVWEAAADHLLAGPLAALAAPSGPQAAAEEGGEDYCDNCGEHRPIVFTDETGDGQCLRCLSAERDRLAALVNALNARLPASPAGVPADRARDEDEGRLRAVQAFADHQAVSAATFLRERDALAAAVARVRALCDEADRPENSARVIPLDAVIAALDAQ